MTHHDEQLHQAVTALQQDGVIIFPTDTVWGIGASAGSQRGIEKLYRLKNRPSNQPTAVLTASIDQARVYGNFLPQAQNLAETYWPGALTLIVPATAHAPRKIQGAGNTIGLRVPDHSFVIDLCLKLGEGIVASSANRAGTPPPLERGEVDFQLLHQVDYAVTGIPSGGQAASTIIDATSAKINQLRRGELTINK